MTKLSFKFAGAAAALAASSMAIPVHAASMATPTGDAAVAAHAAWSVSDETAEGWGRHRHWRRHRVDGGDVLAGILILGGVVAVAKAIENSNERKYRERDDRYRDRDYRYRDYDRDADYRDDRYRRDGYRSAPRYADASRRGIDGAIEECVYAVERDEEVRTVDTAERDGSGWRIEGELDRGGRYECEIGPDGRIRDIDLDRDYRAAADGDYRDAAPRDAGYGDDYYAEARARQEEQMPDRQVETVESEDDREWRRGEPDDRYETVEGPDLAMAQ